MSKFDINKLKGSDVKNAKAFKKHNPSTSLKNASKVQKVLLQCIAGNDLDAFREILLGHLEAIDKESFSEVSGVPLRTIYRMIAADSNPTIKNVSRVINALDKAC